MQTGVAGLEGDEGVHVFSQLPLVASDQAADARSGWAETKKRTHAAATKGRLPGEK